MSAPVYRWPDGSEVSLQFTFKEKKAEPILWYGRGWPPIVFAGAMKAGTNQPVLYLEAPSDTFDEVIEKEKAREKLLGFVLDLGVDRFSPSWRGLVTTHIKVPAVLDYPRFVSDEVWMSRFEMARKRVAPWILGPLAVDQVKGPFISEIGPLSIQHDPERIDGEWYAKLWNTPSSESGTMSFEARTLEDAVRQVLDYELVLPISERDAWEKKNVVRGTFLLPTEEEVEVFRMLGEPLPFFWGEARFKTWLESVGVTP